MSQHKGRCTCASSPKTSQGILTLEAGFRNVLSPRNRLPLSPPLGAKGPFFVCLFVPRTPRGPGGGGGASPGTLGRCGSIGGRMVLEEPLLDVTEACRTGVRKDYHQPGWRSSRPKTWPSPICGRQDDNFERQEAFRSEMDRNEKNGLDTEAAGVMAAAGSGRTRWIRTGATWAVGGRCTAAGPTHL